MVDSYMENKDALRNNKLPIKRSVDAKADEIKVEMPDLPHSTGPEVVNIPDDILKTFLCAIFMGCGQPYAFLNLKSPPSLSAEEAAIFYFTPCFELV